MFTGHFTWGAWNFFPCLQIYITPQRFSHMTVSAWQTPRIITFPPFSFEERAPVVMRGKSQHLCHNQLPHFLRSPLPAFWLVELLLGDMLYVIVLWYSEKLQLWIRKQSRLDRVSLAQVVLSRYFSHTSWMVLINNYSKSPNGLWVNSPVGLQPHRLLTQSPFGLQE